jgi:ATP-binding cassette subfamily B protein
MVFVVDTVRSVRLEGDQRTFMDRSGLRRNLTMTASATRSAPVDAPALADGPSGVPVRVERGWVRILGPIRSRLLVCLVLVVVSTAASMVPMVGIVELARTVLPGLAGENVDAGRAWLVVWVSVGALAVRLITLMLAAWVSHITDLDLGQHIRQRLVDRLGRVPLSWFSDRNSGLVKKAVEDDVAALHKLVAHAVLEVTAAVAAPAIVVVYLFVVDWRMALITLVPMAAGVFGFAWAMRGSTAQYLEYDRSMGQLGSAGVEFVHGISVVKIFGQVGRAHRRFTESADRFADFYRGWIRQSTLGMIVMELAVAPVTTIFIVLLGGTALVRFGQLAPLTVVPFVVLGLALTAPILTIGASLNALREATQAADGIAALLREPVLPQPDRPSPGPAGQVVEFTGVHFAYGDTAVLHDINLTLAPGTVTALVGPSGAGKSTLARLLPRFADVAAGAITVGGVDLRELTSAQLYQQVSFVFQDVSLLRTSIRDNIRLARPDADDDAVRKAAVAAQIADRIDALPDGFDTVIGEGVALSGGEAQRVSIARALLADTPILVLDEATAAADPESEAQVQRALSTLVSGRTLLVIAHRLSTIAGADQIVVLENGHVVARGRHAELLADNGLYARMWAADHRDQDVPTGRVR